MTLVAYQLLRINRSASTLHVVITDEHLRAIDGAAIGVLGHVTRLGRPNALAVTPYVVDGRLLVTSTLALIDKAVEIAKLASPMIRPVRVNGEDMYVMFIHPSQTTSLRTSTTTGNWQDIQKAAMMGGQTTNNPIFKGSLGVYNNVILHESARITPGVHSALGTAVANTRRAVLCGAQACALGYGQKFSGGENYNWVEELFDYERELGVSAQSIWGLKKTVFNSVDFSTIAISTYAALAS